VDDLEHSRGHPSSYARTIDTRRLHLRKCLAEWASRASPRPFARLPASRDERRDAAPSGDAITADDFVRFTHWCRNCAREWSPACSVADDASSAASVSRGRRGAVGAPRPGWRSAAAGSPGLRASSRAGTRRAGITGASANSCRSGPESATGSARAPRRLPISHLEQYSRCGWIKRVD